MKHATLSLSLGAGVLLFGFTLLAEPRAISPGRDFMRQKLDHAQSVLEGITSEDFVLISVHANKLAAMSDQPDWRALDTAEYAQQSALFKRTAEALGKAARERNLDAATLAYTKMTFSCVECHKYIRTRKVALDSVPNNSKQF